MSRKFIALSFAIVIVGQASFANSVAVHCWGQSSALDLKLVADDNGQGAVIGSLAQSDQAEAVSFQGSSTILTLKRNLAGWATGGDIQITSSSTDEKAVFHFSATKPNSARGHGILSVTSKAGSAFEKVQCVTVR